MNQFGLFRPDTADTSDPSILRQASNVLYMPGGLKPCPSLLIDPTATAISEAPRGGISGVTAEGVYIAIVGTATTLQRYNTDGTWTVLLSGLNCTAGDNWSFTTIGKYVIATNSTDGMHYYDLDAGGAFAPITGTNIPANVRIVFTAFNCLFGGDCNGNNRTLRNSNFYDPFNWGAGVAGTQEMQVGEEILGGGEVGLNAALLIQRNGVTPMAATGTSSLYNMGTTAQGIGATNPEAIVFAGGNAFMADHNGFYVSDASGVPQPIGEGKVDDWFASDISADGAERIQGAYWHVKNAVVWRYKSGSSGGDVSVTDDALVLDTRNMEFTTMSVTATLVVTMATPGYTTDGMDGFGTTDEMIQIATDSRYWFGGEPRLGALDSDFKFGFLEGPNAEATIEGSTNAGRTSSLISRAKLVSDADDFDLYIGVSDDLSDDLTWKGPFVKGSRGGAVPTRARGKNIRFRTIIAEADPWTYLTGVDDITASSGGAL